MLVNMYISIIVKRYRSTHNTQTLLSQNCVISSCLWGNPKGPVCVLAIFGATHGALCYKSPFGLSFQALGLGQASLACVLHLCALFGFLD